MDPYFFLQITPEILGAHRQSRVEALKKAGVVGLVDALLPEEFVDGYADRALAAPDWLGFWVLKGGEVIGSGGYKSAPVDGVTEIGYGIHPEFWSKGGDRSLRPARLPCFFPRSDHGSSSHPSRGSRFAKGFDQQRV